MKHTQVEWPRVRTTCFYPKERTFRPHSFPCIQDSLYRLKIARFPGGRWVYSLSGEARLGNGPQWRRQRYSALEKKSSFFFFLSLSPPLSLSLSQLFSGSSFQPQKAWLQTLPRSRAPLLMFTHSCHSFLPKQLNVQKIISISLCLSLQGSMETLFHHFLAR